MANGQSDGFASPSFYSLVPCYSSDWLQTVFLVFHSCHWCNRGMLVRTCWFLSKIQTKHQTPATCNKLPILISHLASISHLCAGLKTAVQTVQGSLSGLFVHSPIWLLYVDVHVVSNSWPLVFIVGVLSMSPNCVHCVQRLNAVADWRSMFVVWSTVGVIKLFLIGCIGADCICWWISKV